MRVSVTLSDDVNKLISEHAIKTGVSKDKLISGIVDDWILMCGNQKKHLTDVSELRDELSIAYQEIGLLRHQLAQANNRGAGRKKQFGDAHKLAMQAHKANGLSYREISRIYDCSVATVHKLINE